MSASTECSVCGLFRGTHQCQFSNCQKIFSSAAELRAHLDRNHSTCAMADQQHIALFASMDIANGVFEVPRAAALVCGDCSLAFESAAAKQHHIVVAHQFNADEMEYCMDCGVAVRTSEWRLHLRKSHIVKEIDRLSFNAKQLREQMQRKRARADAIQNDDLQLQHAYNRVDVNQFASNARPLVYPESFDLADGYQSDDAEFAGNCNSDVDDEVPISSPVDKEDDNDNVSSDYDGSSEDGVDDEGADPVQVTINDGLWQKLWPLQVELSAFNGACATTIVVSQHLQQRHVVGARTGTRVYEAVDNDPLSLTTSVRVMSLTHAMSERDRDELLMLIAAHRRVGSDSPACLSSTYQCQRYINTRLPVPQVLKVQLPGKSNAAVEVAHVDPMASIVYQLQCLVDSKIAFATATASERQEARATVQLLRGVVNGDHRSELKLEDVGHVRFVKNIMASPVVEVMRERFAAAIAQGALLVPLVITRDEAYVVRKTSLDFFRMALGIDPTMTYFNVAAFGTEVDFQLVFRQVLGPLLDQLHRGVRVVLRDGETYDIVGDLAFVTGDKKALLEAAGVGSKMAVHIPAPIDSAQALALLDTDGCFTVAGQRSDVLQYRCLTAQLDMVRAATVAVENDKPLTDASIKACAVAKINVPVVQVISRQGLVSRSVLPSFLQLPVLRHAVSLGSAGLLPSDHLHQVFTGLIDHAVKRVGRSIGWANCKVINNMLRLLPPPPVTAALDNYTSPKLYMYHQSRNGEFYNVKIVTQSATQRQSKLYVLALCLFELEFSAFAEMIMRLAMYDIISADPRTTVRQLREAQLKWRDTLRACLGEMHMPPTKAGVKYADPKTSRAEKERLLMQYLSFPKWLDEKILVDRIATGGGKITATTKPERMHQHDKNTAREHSARRDTLMPVAVLNRSYERHAIDVMLGTAYKTPVAMNSYTLDIPLRGDALQKDRALLNQPSAACYGAIRIQSSKEASNALPLMRFHDRTCVVRLVLQDGAEVVGRVLSGFSPNGTDVNANVVIDRLEIVPLLDEDDQLQFDAPLLHDADEVRLVQQRFRATRCRPLVASGLVTNVLLSAVVELEELLVTAFGEHRARATVLSRWQPPVGVPLVQGTLCTWHSLLFLFHQAHKHQ